jgi:hypothetical protein
MKHRASLVVAMTLGFVVLTAGSSWARPHGGVAATVFPDGTAVFTTTNGPAPADIKVTVASYTGLWKNQTEPEMLFAATRGTIAAGTSSLTLKVAIPSCGPFEMDSFLGWQIPDKIFYPEGNGPNGLKGQQYDTVLPPCTVKTPTPTPSVSPSVTPSISPIVASDQPSTTPSARGEAVAASDASLAATGSPAVGYVVVAGLGLLLLGVAGVTGARRARRH